jgi:hypothetical protein
MQRWFAIAAFVWLLAASGAHAQMARIGAVDVAEVAKNRSLDLRISEAPIIQRQQPLVPSMLIHQDVAPNAAVGIGLANIYAKRRGGDFRVGQGSVRSRKPAVTFVFRF